MHATLGSTGWGRITINTIDSRLTVTVCVCVCALAHSPHSPLSPSVCLFRFVELRVTNFCTPSLVYSVETSFAFSSPPL